MSTRSHEVWYIDERMGEQAPPDFLTPVSESAPKSCDQRRWLAILSSAAVPGSGQLLLGQRRKGSILICVFLLLLICFWPLRVLHYYVGFVLLYCTWICLYLYAACAATLTRFLDSSKAYSKLWLVPIVALTCVTASVFGSRATKIAGFRSFKIPSTSMEKTILMGDHIVVDTRRFVHEFPTRQEVITFKRDNVFFIKRVIAVGGDSIEGRYGQVLVNDAVLDEPYVQHTGQPPDWMNNFGPRKVPVGEYFVMGDNRDVSLDSRSPEFGLVSVNSVIGAPLYVFGSDRPGKGIH
jgi:signal peptidase I